MVRVVLVLAIIGITLYALIDCLRSADDEIRALPKPLWLLVIIALPPVGGLLWIWIGLEAPGGTGGTRHPRVLAPDDDPDFLRSLNPPRAPGRRDPDPPDPA